MKYEIGDIVWVAEFKERESRSVNNHLFVVINDDGEIVPAEYFGFVVSSNIGKSKENSEFKYNEPVEKSDNNKLRTKSIVKCDQLFTIPSECINHKIGTMDVEDIMRFLQAYNDFINN
nr:MAG TPA: PemK-like protein [Caudoviricetes sp.]